MDNKEYIQVRGAKANNLQGADVDIPRGKFVVVTGLSGSGKSSLAFDTIYAEGQRRYMDTLSTYAKHFMGILEKPEVEEITGLSPIIAIEQKTTGSNPRSTVGTITEIYDFLRLLYAKGSRAISPESGREMVRYTDAQIVDLVMTAYRDRKCYLLAPLVRGRKGHYRELFDQLRKRGELWHTRLLSPWEFSRQESWSGLPCPPPGELPNTGMELRCATLQVGSLPSSHQGSPRILDWVAYPFSRGTSRHGNQNLYCRQLLYQLPQLTLITSLKAPSPNSATLRVRALR